MHENKKEAWFPIVSALLVAAIIFAGGILLEKGKKSSSHIIFETETKYYTMRIVDVGRGSLSSARIMYLDIDSHSIVFNDPTEGFTSYTGLAPVFSILAPTAKNIHVIGAGAYVLPAGFAKVFPDANVSVTEIDPAVEQAAEAYFGLDTTRITTIAKDSRVHFAVDEPVYDIVFGDAYNSFISVPWHLTTQEFTELVRSRLTPNGVYAINMIGAPKGEDSLFFQSMLKTFSSVFPNYYIFGFGNDLSRPQNVVLVGVNGAAPMSANELKQKLAEDNNTKPFSRFLITDETISTSEGILLTDDFAPVENLMIPAMKEYFGPYLNSFRDIIKD